MQYCKFINCLSTLLANYSLVVDFVSYRHLEQPLENIIIFQNRKFPSDVIELELEKRLQIPQLLVSSAISPDLRDYQRIRTLALVFLMELDTPGTRTQVSQSFKHHVDTPLIFVCKTVPTKLEMWKFFAYFHKQNMFNVLLLYRVSDERMKVHTMAPYPELQIIELDAKNFSSFIQPKHRNVMGYNFLISVFDDPPVAGKLEVENRTELSGLTAHVLQVFMKRLNGTKTILGFPLNASIWERIDIAANFIFRIDLNERTSTVSYPLFQTQICLMLPIESNIPLSWYLWYAFDYWTWLALGFAIFTILALGIFVHKTTRRRTDNGQFFLLLFRLIIAQPFSLYSICTSKRNIALLFLCALFMVLTNIYESSLTSLVSTHVRMPEVRTTEDFLKTKLKILIVPFERQVYFEAGLLPRSLISRLLEMPIGATSAHRRRGNISYAYVMTREKWLWYEKQQKHLDHPVFRIATGRLCTPPMLQVFALRKQSPFRGVLKLLFLELQQFGMVDHWLSEVPPASKLELRNGTDTGAAPLSLEHFTWGFCILGVGWSLALLAFLGELIVWRRREILRTRRFWWLKPLGRGRMVNEVEVRKVRLRKHRAERFRMKQKTVR